MQSHHRSAVASLVAACAALVLTIGAHHAIAAQGTQVASTPPAACNECKDLCRLMDRYLQREKGIELWKQYTYKNRKNIPANVKDMGDIGNLVVDQFNEWSKSRRPDSPSGGTPDNRFGLLPCELPRGSGAGGANTDLATTPVKTSKADVCDIVDAEGNRLEGFARAKFDKDKNCKAESDAIVEHEKVHQQFCRAAYANPTMNATQAAKFLDSPEVTAESEVEAWTKERDELAKAIRNIVNGGKCGWQPTEGQKADPNSIPSLPQLQKMSQDLWQAASALSGDASLANGGK